MALSVFKDFPSEELGRMISNIDRFDTEVVSQQKINADKAINIAEKVSEQLIDETYELPTETANILAETPEIQQ